MAGRESSYNIGAPNHRGSSVTRLSTKENREAEGEEGDTSSNRNSVSGARENEEAAAEVPFALFFADQCSKETEPAEAPCVEYVKANLLPTIQQARVDTQPQRAAQHACSTSCLENN